MRDELLLREVSQLLFGDGGDELVAKMNPTQSDLAAKDRKKRAATAALSGVGAAAGAGGLTLAGQELRHGYKEQRAAQAKTFSVHRPKARLRAMRAAVGASRKTKVAAALLPLEVAGLGGELAATKILHGDTKHGGPSKKVQKDLGDMLNNAKVPSKGSLTRATIPSPQQAKKGLEYTKKGAGVLRQLPNKMVTTNQVDKRADEVDVLWSGEFAKADVDKQQVFGWASVVEVNGEPVVDLQGDVISTDEMEKAGYEYVMKSRKGGDMHLRNEWQPVQKSEMIESFIVTPEKRDAMGLPDSVPSGWWVGFQVQDPEVWSMIKDGRRTGFSIHGHGRRSDA